MKESTQTKNKTGAKILRFDGGEKRLDRSIQKRLDAGDYLASLRLINRRNEFFTPTVDSLALQADVYEFMEANSQALRTWYRFLNICDESALAEAYEGLAVNYMNLGKESQAAYYYNLLLRVDDELTEESKMDIVEMFSKPKRDAFKIVYPPERADYTEQMEKGLRALKDGDFACARTYLEQVQEGAKQYKNAQNLLAITCLLEDKKDEARNICQKLLSQDENDVQANTTYAALLGQSEERQKAKEIAIKLSKIQTSDSDELYKIATVCCENDMHAQALEKFVQLEKEIKNDGNLLYFKAVAAFKSGDVDLAIETFGKLLTVYPEAAVVRYYYDILRYYRENKEKEVPMPELTYFYRVPQPVREKYFDLLCFLDKLRKDEAKVVSDNPQVEGVLRWCFDELDGADGDLQIFAVCVAIHCHCEDFLQEMLLDPDVSDVVKLKALHLLAVQNEDCEYGVVIYHIYRRLKFYRIKTGVKKRKRFLEAYASVYAKFVVVSDNYAQRIRAAAELLYNCLLVREATGYIDNTADISCVIYMLAGIKEAGATVEAASKLFGANAQTVQEILSLVETVTQEVMQRESQNKPAQEE